MTTLYKLNTFAFVSAFTNTTPKYSKAPDTRYRNRRHGLNFDAIPSPVFQTSLTAFGARMQSVAKEVVRRHENLAPESGGDFMATDSGACDSGLS